MDRSEDTRILTALCFFFVIESVGAYDTVFMKIKDVYKITFMRSVMFMTTLGTGEDFLIGFAKGESVQIENTLEQICAFIMKHKMDSVVITTVLDGLVLETSMGFIMTCPNQEFLRIQLIPALAPMQMGDAEIPEFVPFVSEDGEEVNYDEFDDYMETRDEFLERSKKELGEKEFEGMKSSLDNEYYGMIEMLMKEGDTISQVVYDSLTEGQRYHFNKHYNHRNDKVVG